MKLKWLFLLLLFTNYSVAKEGLFSTYSPKDLKEKLKEIKAKGLDYKISYETKEAIIFSLVHPETKHIYSKALDLEKLDRQACNKCEITQIKKKVKYFSLYYDKDSDILESIKYNKSNIGLWNSFLKDDYYSRAVYKSDIEMIFKNTSFQFAPMYLRTQASKDILYQDLTIYNGNFSLLGSNYYLSLGPKVVSWGLVDEFSELDVASLKYTPLFFMEDLKDTIMPMNLVYLELFLDTGTASFFLNPTLYDGYFLKEDDPFSVIQFDKGLVLGLSNSEFSSVIRNSKNTNLKRSKFGAGFKYDFSLYDADFSIIYSVGQSGVPSTLPSAQLLSALRTGIVDDEALKSGFVSEYFYLETLGLSSVFSLNDNLLKMELFRKSGYNDVSQDLAIVNVDRIGGILELESYIESLDLQLNIDSRYTYRMSKVTMLSDSNEASVTVNLEKKFFNEKFKVSFRSIYDLIYSGINLRVKTFYSLSDNVNLQFSGHYFDGPKDSYFGFVSENYNVLGLEMVL